MRIISANLNGIRSAAKKGFFDWLTEKSGADILCIQETKAQIHQLDDAVFNPDGWHRYFFDAVKPGYSGTAIYSRREPDAVRTGLGFEICDTQGRWIEAQFGDLTVVSLYLPSGSANEDAQARKDIFLGELMPMLKARQAKGEKLIICGDWNIAHKEIDLKNWKGNLKNSGFLPHERAWLTTLFDDTGFVDAFRLIDERADRYTWWSNRGQAYANNVGWRIDYHIISENLRERVQAVDIYTDEKFSDHAPLIIDYTD
ncbi:exodeoxyribonuclease III [Paraperlucidibaca sp.]|jgi:exodeoxyribonuclease-3|uniref:exodeoxyribonuclease III n=1 Tax=Paraperlucidibaca sp. TaxID=2708021 RepID=UPI00398A1EE9|tara:strand:+ start:3648 stop:4418 length:771 start_codon:yes stop_codon:yes gene_type:complete